MKLAVLHHHFDRGGVTQVVLNHLAGFAAADSPIEKILLIHGGRCGGLPESFAHFSDSFETQVLCVEGLEYDASPQDESTELAAKISSTILAAGGDVSDTILHIHNHSLGKNASMPGAVRKLAESDWPIVAQIHDFAEDYRCENYRMLIEALGCQTPEELERQLYPQAANIHYATLTQRDHKLLASIAVAPSRLHRFSNSVVFASDDTTCESAVTRRRVRDALHLDQDALLGLYPVRGIRRKNVGEMLLWAAVCQDATFAITLPPSSPAERSLYDLWVGLAKKLNLPVRFDVGVIDGVTFADNMAAADFIFTSSVAEGFGMVFLESMLAGKPLLGRDLPGVTLDFRAKGLNFPGLALAIHVPTAAVGEGLASQTWEAYCSAWKALPDSFIDALGLDSADPTRTSEFVDFGRLPVGLQAKVIAAANADASVAAQIRQANPTMQMVTRDGLLAASESLAAGAEIVRREFAPAALSAQICEVYEKLLAADRGGPVSPPSEADQLFGQLAGFESFFPCRTIEIG